VYQTRQLESVNKFYEPQNRAKINLFETKTNVLLCFEVCLLVLTYPRKENTSDLIYLSYFASCYLQCFVLIVSSSVCLQCLSPVSVSSVFIAVARQLQYLCARLCPYPFAVSLVMPKILKEI